MGLTRLEIATNVRENLGDNGISWYSIENINSSIADGYNILSAILNPIQKTTFIPLRATPYYPLTDSVPDLFSIMGLYNPQTNLWLDYLSTVEMNKLRWDWEKWNGQSAFWTPLSFRMTCIIPWNPLPTGALYMAYIASADKLSDTSIPNIPQSCGTILENYSTCDLLEQSREFKKAQLWLEKFKDNLSDAKLIIKDLARIHRMRVMEPWSVMGRYSGAGHNMTIISNETPTGAINGINTEYTLAQIPNPTSSLAVYKNGQLLYQGDSFTLTGNKINLSTQAICSGNDSLLVWYEVT